MPELSYDTFERLITYLAIVVVFAMILERASAQLFEWSPWKNMREKIGPEKYGLNTIFAFIFAWLICKHAEFDAILQVFPRYAPLDAMPAGAKVMELTGKAANIGLVQIVEQGGVPVAKVETKLYQLIWYDGMSIGTIITAAVIAGGSKGAIKLFQGVLGFGREAIDAQIALKKHSQTVRRGNQPQTPR